MCHIQYSMRMKTRLCSAFSYIYEKWHQTTLSVVTENYSRRSPELRRLWEEPQGLHGGLPAPHSRAMRARSHPTLRRKVPSLEDSGKSHAGSSTAQDAGTSSTGVETPSTVVDGESHGGSRAAQDTSTGGTGVGTPMEEDSVIPFPANTDDEIKNEEELLSSQLWVQVACHKWWTFTIC